MKRVRLYLLVSMTLVLVLLLSAAPGAFAGPSGPGEINDPFVRAARFYNNGRAPQRAVDAPAGMQVLATGLDNGRGITIGPDGGLYVAEAGSGDPAHCAEVFPGMTMCVGDTGAVTRIENGVQERIATGMPSLADPSGFGSAGPHGVTWKPRDAFFVTTGLGFGLTPDQMAAINSVGEYSGKLLRMNPAGYWNVQADIHGYEAANNPDGGEIDSNPYGVVAVQGRNRIVADAGGNSVLKVNNVGHVSTLAVFPDRLVTAPPFLGLPPGAQMPMQAVPTAVVSGPGNTVYVGELTGFPFPSGGANVYQVWPSGYKSVVAGGFSAIVGMAMGPDGSLYVVEIAHDLLACETMGVCDGRLYRIGTDGVVTMLASGLPYPGGVAVSNSGDIYLTLGSIFPAYAGGGMVVRLN